MLEEAGFDPSKLSLASARSVDERLLLDLHRVMYGTGRLGHGGGSFLPEVLHRESESIGLPATAPQRNSQAHAFYIHLPAVWDRVRWVARLGRTEEAERKAVRRLLAASAGNRHA